MKCSNHSSRCLLLNQMCYKSLAEGNLREEILLLRCYIFLSPAIFRSLIFFQNFEAAVDFKGAEISVLYLKCKSH